MEWIGTAAPAIWSLQFLLTRGPPDYFFNDPERFVAIAQPSRNAYGRSWKDRLLGSLLEPQTHRRLLLAGYARLQPYDRSQPPQLHLRCLFLWQRCRGLSGTGVRYQPVR